MGEYILKIICSAMILGALGSLCGEGTGVRKVVFGMFLLFMVLDPISGLELEKLPELPQIYYQEGRDLQEAAKQKSEDQMCAVIMEAVESYILVEADSLGMEIEVDSVDLDPDSMVPVSVSLSGAVGAYEKQMLSEYIVDRLGIGREEQKWNGEH